MHLHHGSEFRSFGDSDLLAEVVESLARLTKLEHDIHARRMELQAVATYLRQGGDTDIASARLVKATRRDSLLAELGCTGGAVIALAVGAAWLAVSAVVGLVFGVFCVAGRGERPPVGNKSRDAILEVAGQGGR